MNWILEHLQLLFVVGGGLAWWLNQRRQAKEESASAPPAEAVGDDPDLAERTRRIREEIQRKIDQRTRGQQQTVPSRTPAEPPPLVRQEPEQRYEVPPPRLPKVAASHYENQRTAEILEQQAALNERLRQAQEMKAAALRRAQSEQRASGRSEAGAKTAVRAALTQELRDPDALRRAFILREIIGPPVGLR